MGVYGRTFAAELNEKGKYDEGEVSAASMIEKDGDNPEHWYDRAVSLVALGKHAAAANDAEKALALDTEAQVLDEDEVDDLLFSSLLAVAKTEGDAGTLQLDRYLRVRPTGRHVGEVGDWKRRLRGELKTDWVKNK